MRLQQFKNSKSKRIGELEAKMRDVEVIENIDLNKVLEELRTRDKRITELQQTDKNVERKLDAQERDWQKRVKVLEA